MSQNNFCCRLGSAMANNMLDESGVCSEAGSPNVFQIEEGSELGTHLTPTKRRCREVHEDSLSK